MLKRLFLPLLLFVFAIGLRAQIVTTTPAIVTSASTIITIHFNAVGTALEGYTSDVYTHTGVITDRSSADSDWKYAPTWLDNSAKYKLTPAGANRWTLTLTPHINAYYGVTTGEKVQKLAFVFRNADGSREAKDQGKDLFVAVIPHSELVVQIQSPKRHSIFELTELISIRVVASERADLTLYVGSTQSAPIASITNSGILTAEFSPSEYTDLRFIAQATNKGTTTNDTLPVSILRPSPSLPRPSDLKEGIHLRGQEVSFLLYAPGKQNATLLGDFNDFIPTNQYVMNRDGDYFWSLVPGLNPNQEYAYQYLIDKTIRVADPHTEKILDPWNDSYINQHEEVYRNLRPYPSALTTDIVGCFQLQKPAFEWNDDTFVRPARENLVIYELLFRDFTQQGSVHAAIQKLDYLQSLGINAIELMPIQEFEGNDSWGYNPNFFFALDKAYGDDLRYKEFVNECHKRKIAVIVDVVFNHSWGQHPWCKMWYDETSNRPSPLNPFYNTIATHPYSVGNDFNHANPKLRSHFSQALQHLMNEYHVDGFRFDLSKGFTQRPSGSDVGRWGEYDASRIGYIKEYVDAIHAISPSAYAIMEHFAASNEENEIAAYRGTQLWRNMNHAFTQAAMGYASGSDYSSLANNGRVGYMESHDEERIAYKTKAFAVKGIKGDSIAQFNRIVAGAAFAFLTPGARMLWQFGEWGYDVPIDYNGRTGRKPSRWDYYQRPERKAMADAFSRIIRFRTDNPLLFTDPTLSFNWSVSEQHWKQGRFLNIESSHANIVVAANYSLSSITPSLSFPHSGEWHDLISGRTYYIPTAKGYEMRIPASSAFAFVDKAPASTPTPPVASTDKAYFDELRHVLYVISSAPIQSLELFTASGVKCAQSDTDYVVVNNLAHGLYLVNVINEKGTRKTIKVVK